MDSLESREQDVIRLTKELNEKNSYIKDQRNHILNLQHSLQMMSDALDEKELRLARMYLRCALLTEKQYCQHCASQENCRFLLITHEYDLLGCDPVAVARNHEKEEKK